MHKKNRVVVTGIGILAPNGTGLEAFWKSLLEGRSGIGPITLFDASKHPTRIAGEVKNFDPFDYFEREAKPKRMARHTQLGFAATKMALKDAGLDVRSLGARHPLPVIFGVSTSSIDIIEGGLDQLRTSGPAKVSSLIVSNGQPQATASVIAQSLGTAVHATTISAACVSGIAAVASAAAMIADGKIDYAVAGGADAPVTPLTMASFASSGLSSTSKNHDPAKSNRPFDCEAEGGMVSEGAGVLILENRETALARGAHIYLELSGYASETDSDANEPASALEHSMQMALANSGKRPEDIDYISAYGTGHPILDGAETTMIKRVFGPHAYSVPVSSIKGVTGNPLAAGGPFQIAACAMTFRDQKIPPTANCERVAANCDLDYVPGRARRCKVNSALINVRGLGGGSGCLVVERLRAA